MAYLLRFDGANDYLTLNSTINIGPADDFRIRWRWPTASSGNHRVLGGDSVVSASSRIIHFANGNITVYGGTGGNIGFSQATDQSVDREIEIRRTAGNLTLHYDGQQQGPAQSSSQSFTFGVLGGNFNTATVASDLYTINFEINGQLVSAYDPSASIGQSELVDTANGNNGTPVNFPANFDVALIFYNDGSVEISGIINANIGALTYNTEASIGNEIQGNSIFSLEPTVYTIQALIGNSISGLSNNLLQNSSYICISTIGSEILGNIIYTLFSSTYSSSAVIGQNLIANVSYELDEISYLSTMVIGNTLFGSLSYTVDDTSQGAQAVVGNTLLGNYNFSIKNMAYGASSQLGLNVQAVGSIETNDVNYSLIVTVGNNLLGEINYNLESIQYFANSIAGVISSLENDISVSISLTLPNIYINSSISINNIYLTGEI